MQHTGPAASPASAQVAAVIVDPTALTAATAALEANSLTQQQANKIAQKQVEATDDLVKAVAALRGQLVHVAARLG